MYVHGACLFYVCCCDCVGSVGMFVVSQSLLKISDTWYPSLADEHIILLKVFALLYADDTVVQSDNEKEIQLALDSEYCTLYNLTVNTSKTKIIVFSRGKVKCYSIFSYGDDTIEVVSDYVYLGVTINYNNEFFKVMRKQLDQARKAQFSMLIKCRKPELPIDMQCKLFESMVIPVILYGCEIWGFQDIKMLEISYRKFLKKVLKLRPSISNCMVYGEVENLPLQISVYKQLISY